MKKILFILIVLCLVSCGKTPVNKCQSTPVKVDVRCKSQIVFDDFLKHNRQKFSNLMSGNKLVLIDEISKYESELYDLCDTVEVVDFIGVITNIQIDETNEYIHFNNNRGMHLTFEIETCSKYSGDNLDGDTVVAYICDYVLNKNNTKTDKLAMELKKLEDGDSIKFSGNFITEDRRNLYVTSNGCMSLNMQDFISSEGIGGLQDGSKEISSIISPRFAFDIKNIKKIIKL